jgi:Big-like domain-containing protein
MEKVHRRFNLLLSLFLLLFVVTGGAHAAPVIVSPSPNSVGEIERITLNNPADVYSGGVMVVGGSEMIIPKNLLIDLPANRLSLQQIFDQAPAACKALGESGLAKGDRCNQTGSGGIATLSAVRTNAGNVIIGDLFIQKAAESVVGQVSYINYAQGYYRVNGLPNDPNTGVMVRLNDPTGRHTVQNGFGCLPGSLNCSPDPRFNLDPDNYTNTFSTGYPVCIPSTVARSFPGLPALTGIPAIPAQTTQAAAGGTGDLLCPDTNRSNVAVEPPVADSRLFAPVKVGDSVLAEGNYETINGVRFLSAHTTNVQKALLTKNEPGQPDYLFLEEVFIEAPAFQNQRQRAMWIGFTTLAPTDVDIWSVHRDPVNNAIHEFPLASVAGCDIADAGSFPSGICSQQGIVGAGANIFKIRYDVDFLMANNPPITPGGAAPRLNPCLHLQASPRFRVSNPGICPGGATQMFANNIGILGPVPHEIIARTGHRLDSTPGSLVTLDVKGAASTNGEYLFPLGMNLGGIEVAEMSEINLNLLNTPPIFEGIPWNLDRRLSPSGCLNVGGCETAPMGSFALDPFPFTGLDPRTQADFNVILPGVGLQVGGMPTGSYNDPHFNNSVNPLSNVRNRMFSYVDGTLVKANGDFTVLPYALGTFPADPPLIAIAPTPPLGGLFAPIAIDDSATTGSGVAKVIAVTTNDIALFSAINPASVAIATGPVNGIATPNPSGTITYTPNATFVSGTDSFTYNVTNQVGAVSNNATVTVTVTATKPTGTIAINGGAAFTNSAIVTLTLSATSPNGAVTQMQFSKDGVNFFAFEPFAATRVATLLPGDGLKTMYVRFRDTTGSISPIFSASITLNSVAPAGTIVINGGATITTSANVNLTLATTSVSGLPVTKMQFSSDGVNYFTFEPFATARVFALPLGNGPKTVFVRFQDAAGTVSAPVSSSIALNAATLSGTVGINGGATLTNSASVTLSLTATSSAGPVTQMQISKDGLNYFPLEPFAATRTITLLPGDGLKTIFVRFMDGAGNLSAAISASITLDSTQPAGTIAFTTADPTTSATGTLALTATDASGVTQMQFSKDGVNFFPFEPFATSRTVTLAPGLNTLSVRFKDGAGNVSAPVSASITRN